jgi:16S rRNA A1518/A1519 N6-dimethyltransferase RsmA/KsgA/DIM1 with predicted DNA glycosylase/AP lyase activity
MLEQLGLRSDIRAENLTIEDFARLTNEFIDGLSR